MIHHTTKQIELAQSIFEAMNRRDPDLLTDCLAPDAVFDFPGTDVLVGPRRIKLFLKILFRKYPRLTFTVDDIIDSGNKLVVVWHNEGITTSGTSYHNRGVTIVHVRDGRITMISDYFKDTSFTTSSPIAKTSEGV